MRLQDLASFIPPERPCLAGAEGSWMFPHLRGIARNLTSTALSFTQQQHEAGLGETPRARQRFFHHRWIFSGEVWCSRETFARPLPAHAALWRHPKTRGSAQQNTPQNSKAKPVVFPFCFPTLYNDTCLFSSFPMRPEALSPSQPDPTRP